jgi:uncharacterized protein (DUF488 family)
VSDEITAWTIGNSTRWLDAFLSLLTQQQIEAIVDVRSFPGSRHYSHFGSLALQDSLARHEIAYHWLPALGGRRRPVPNSRNVVWRNMNFRGYADYMQTTKFATGLDDLLESVRRSRTVLMCAELVWWRCHRSMIADALRARGIDVVHILDAKHTTLHPWTAPARIVDGQLTYVTAENNGSLL